jgi:sugar phosphate isomerase/epimerase
MPPTPTAVSLTENSKTASKAGGANTNAKAKRLGLITFDLDDTLYPIAPVIEEANRAFARSMESFGYGSDILKPQDIVDTGKAIREEIASHSPMEAAVLTHTEIRRLAIRREMERITLTRKLKACADDWATPVSSLSPIVVQHAKK